MFTYTLKIINNIASCIYPYPQSPVDKSSVDKSIKLTKIMPSSPCSPFSVKNCDENNVNLLEFQDWVMVHKMIRCWEISRKKKFPISQYELVQYDDFMTILHNSNFQKEEVFDLFDVIIETIQKQQKTEKPTTTKHKHNFSKTK